MGMKSTNYHKYRAKFESNKKNGNPIAIFGGGYGLLGKQSLMFEDGKAVGHTGYIVGHGAF